MYIIFYFVMFFLLEKTSLAINTPAVYGLLLAIVADIFYFGYGWKAGWFKRA